GGCQFPCLQGIPQRQELADRQPVRARRAEVDFSKVPPAIGARAEVLLGAAVCVAVVALKVARGDACQGHRVSSHSFAALASSALACSRRTPIRCFSEAIRAFSECARCVLRRALRWW